MEKYGMDLKTLFEDEEIIAERDADGDGIQDKYMSGLSKEEKQKRRKEIEKNKNKDLDDPSAYDESNWTTDKGEKTKKSKHTKKYEKMFGEGFLGKAMDILFEKKENYEKALKNKSEETGISYGILKKVYDRGLAAWKTGHRPGASQHAWAMARVNSFATGGKTRTTADKDLWKQHKDSKK